MIKIQDSIVSIMSSKRHKAMQFKDSVISLMNVERHSPVKNV